MNHDQWVRNSLADRIRECRDRLMDVTDIIGMREERMIGEKERTALELMKHEIDLLLSVDAKRKVA